MSKTQQLAIRTKIQKLLDEIDPDKPLFVFLKAAAELDPSGAASATAEVLSSIVQEYRKNRLRIFFGELAKGEIKLTPELVQSESFLHSYFATVKAALNSHREEKIRIFARLFREAAQSDVLSSAEGVDEYEEYLSILDDLTIREMKILVALENYQTKYYDGSHVRREVSTEGLFQEEAARVLGVPKEQISDDELRGIVVRLNRTGCYALMGWRNGPARDCSLTGLYFRLKSLVQNEEGNLI